MPELPEVEVVRRGLAPAVDGALVTSVEVLDERIVRRHDAGSADFAARLIGQRLAEPGRRGKFLWVPVGDRALHVHLAMSGQMLVRAPGSPAERHERVRIWIEHPRHGELELRYVDQRRFGELAVRELVGGVPDIAAHIAPDPLESSFDPAAVVERLRRRTQSVKAALLDQQLVSGVGNIYADEALWRARLHFSTPGQRISRAKGLELLDHVRDVFHQALIEGGTSFDAQYVNVNGQAGYFAHSLNAYGREGQPCPRCGTLMRRVPFGGRSSHYCPRCQRRQ